MIFLFFSKNVYNYLSPCLFWQNNVHFFAANDKRLPRMIRGCRKWWEAAVNDGRCRKTLWGCHLWWDAACTPSLYTEVLKRDLPMKKEELKLKKISPTILLGSLQASVYKRVLPSDSFFLVSDECIYNNLIVSLMDLTSIFVKIYLNSTISANAFQIYIFINLSLSTNLHIPHLCISSTPHPARYTASF